MPPKKKLTVTQYAALRKISRQAVIKAINKGYSLPMVTKTEKYGRQWMLTVEETGK